MPSTLVGSPLGPFGDALLTAAAADTTLSALVGGRIKAAFKRGEKTGFPNICGARRDLLDGFGSVQTEGGTAVLWVDFWSEKNGPHEVQTLMDRMRAIFPRTRVLRLDGFVMAGNSLVCEEEHVFPDFDPDMPEQSLYHGVQKWTTQIEEAH